MNWSGLERKRLYRNLSWKYERMPRKSTISTISVARNAAEYSGYFAINMSDIFHSFRRIYLYFYINMKGSSLLGLICSRRIAIIQGLLERVVLTSRYRWLFRHYGHGKSAQNQKLQPICWSTCKVTNVSLSICAKFTELSEINLTS